MRTLDRKLLRDLRHHWVQVVSIAAVMACGAMTIMGLRSTLASIRRARDAYYAANRFGDVFATLQRAPLSLERHIAEISGVGALQTRIVRDVTLDIPGLAEPAVGHMVSVPEHRGPMLNEVYVRRGRWVAPGRDDEVLVSEPFATLNHLLPGDTLGAVINGRWQRLRVVGVGLSPEFVVEVGAAGVIDNRRYAVLWTSRRTLETAFDMKGAFNDVVVRLAPGASEAAVIVALDRLLAPWGSAGAYGRADQLSARVLTDEFSQLAVYATVYPVFFLIVGAFLLNVVLSRLVSSQREEIAALKAFGYTDREVGAHYLAFALGAVVLGAIAGMAAGVWMGRAFLRLYATYFHFPALPPMVDWWSAALGVGVSGGFALLGALGAVRRATMLPPAEALRPESPGRYRPLLVERLGLGALASPAARMVLRNLERRPLRTAAGVVGIALAIALLTAGRYPNDAFDRMVEVQFHRAARWDFTAVFTQVRPRRAAEELRHVPGVLAAEPFRVTGVRLRHGAAVRTTTITGRDGRGVLWRLLDIHASVYALPPAGAVLTTSLARALHAGVGDTVTAELLELGGIRRPLVVAGLLDEMTGQGVYMDRAALNHLLREGDAITGAYLSVERGAEPAVSMALKHLPGVTGAVSRAAMLRTMEQQMRQSTALVMPIVIGSACLIALGVVYNNARIAISERGRELASLRVLGFTRREVAGMLIGEQVAVTVTAIPVGIVFGLVFTAALARGFQTERFHFPFIADVGTYAFAVAVIAASAAVAALVVRGLVSRLDLVRALKTRE